MHAVPPELLATVFKIRYAELASTTIILFDHALTLDQEIRLIWRAQWSTGKILFLLNRYYALSIVIFNNYVLFTSNSLSASLYVLAPYIPMTSFKSSAAAVSIGFGGKELRELSCSFWPNLRLYALYFGNKRVLATMSIISIGAAIGSAYVMGKALSVITAVPVSLPGSSICVPFGLPSEFFAFWVPMLISESVLCALALYRGFKTYRPGQSMILSGRRIVEILVRDSVWYFVTIFATYLTNAIIFLTRPDSEVEIPIGFAVALSCVMSSRLCLNVREYLLQDSDLPGASNAYRPRNMALISLSRRDNTSDHTDHSISVVPEGGTLTVMEMRQLRQMRAQSPKHLLTLSNAKAGSSEEVK